MASNGTKAEYLNWDKSYSSRPEPNNQNNNEHCAHIRLGDCVGWLMGAWADLDCSKDTLVTFCGSKRLEMSMTAICEFGFQPFKRRPSKAGKENYIFFICRIDTSYSVRNYELTRRTRTQCLCHIRQHSSGGLSSLVCQHRILHVETTKGKDCC